MLDELLPPGKGLEPFLLLENEDIISRQNRMQFCSDDLVGIPGAAEDLLAEPTRRLKYPSVGVVPGVLVKISDRALDFRDVKVV